jgi:hypothetical protein
VLCKNLGWSARHCVRLDKGTTDGMRFIMKVYPPQQSGIPKLMSLYARVCACVCVVWASFAEPNKEEKQEKWREIDGRVFVS